MRYISLARPQDGYNQSRVIPNIEGHLIIGVNEKPFLGLEEERVCTRLDNLHAKYDIIV